MRRSLTAPLPDVPLPDGVRCAPFVPGDDDEAWLGVNSRAFAHHPEQGRWTARRPAAAVRRAVVRPGRLPARRRPRRRPAARLPLDQGAPGRRATQPAIGEIYVLGVDPGGHRRGLGAALSVAGLRHLRGRGLTDALLYVDESNAAAVALYRRLGFEIFSTDVALPPRPELDRALTCAGNAFGIRPSARGSRNGQLALSERSSDRGRPVHPAFTCARGAGHLPSSFRCASRSRDRPGVAIHSKGTL